MKQSNYIRLLGRKVFFEQYKTSDTPTQHSFVLIHGFLSCTFCFHRLVPLLSKKYDIYCIDLIGFGKSEKPADFKYSFESYASLVVEFVKEMGLRNVILLGHSMGGQVCLHAAISAPQFFRSLILVCCSGYLGKTKKTLKLFSYLPIAKPVIKWWIKQQKIEEVLKSTLYEKSLITSEMIQAYSEPIKDGEFCNTLIGLLRDREGDMPTKVLKTISHPVLLIWGEEDLVVPLKHGIRLRMDLPESDLIVIPEAGHQVIEEKPDQVFFEVERWLLNK
jgi:pimeloyl-ACP methyl ester carboxylesterase